MWKLLVVLAVLVFCIVCVSACATSSPTAASPTQAPASATEPANAPEPTAAPEPTHEPPVKESTVYSHPVKSEVILLGSKLGIEQVLTAVPTVKAGLALTVAPSSGEPDAYTGLPVDYICKDCWMQLFDLSSKNPKDVGLIVAIAQLVRTTKGHDVYAAPNYPLLLGDSGVPIAGDPWYIGGSPYYIGGSPIATPYPPNPTARDAFIQQWAFQQPGPSPTPMGIGITIQSSPTTSQSDVTAYIFDTASLSAGGPYPLDPDTTSGRLAVTAPFIGPLDALAPPAACQLARHGLFVAELLHAVAPTVPITLMPVLDQCGGGQLFGLQAALDAAWKDHEKSTAKHGIVLNLSLGVELDSRTADALGVSESHLKQWCDQIYSNADAQNKCVVETKEDVASIRTLEMQLRKMHDKGAVIVAAAGNGSAGLKDNAGSPIADVMQRPAIYDWVIGVSASNSSGGRACYSNEKKGSAMWVRAPGGDGFSGIEVSSGKVVNCVPYSENCDNEGGKDCPYGVISLFQEGPKFQYGYWAGTSFAAPLVSGLAARCLAQDKGWSESLQINQVATKVWEAIRDGAGGPGQVINVPKTLDKCK